MVFHELKLLGAYLIEIEPITDERGFFARSWCRDEFAKRGLNPNLVQCNISFNQHKGTLRGMHWQAEPYGEVKLVRCTRGTIFDVIVDLREDSPTRNQWVGVELSEENRRLLYIPEGFAHGFLTLEDHTEVFYQMSNFFVPDQARGVRYDDPAFGIEWPGEVRVISDKDFSFSRYER